MRSSPPFAPTTIKSMPGRVAIGIGAALLISGAVFAASAKMPIGPDLEALGWKQLTFRNIPETSFTGRADGVLEVRADKSSSVLYRAVGAEAVGATRLSWSWRVIQGIPATDLTTRTGDDRNLTVHVAFAEPGLLNSIKGLFSPFAGGKALNYVWGGAEKKDFAHPHLPDGAWIFVLRTADEKTGAWFSESVDLKADYQRVFGVAPPPIAAVGVSSDADSLGLTTYGWVRDLTLE